MSHTPSEGFAYGPVEGAEPWKSPMTPLQEITARFGAFFLMLEANRELDGEPKFADTDVIVSFMGNGASDALRASDFRKLIGALRGEVGP